MPCDERSSSSPLRESVRKDRHRKIETKHSDATRRNRCKVNPCKFGPRWNLVCYVFRGELKLKRTIVCESDTCRRRIANGSIDRSWITLLHRAGIACRSMLVHGSINGSESVDREKSRSMRFANETVKRNFYRLFSMNRLKIRVLATTLK